MFQKTLDEKTIELLKNNSLFTGKLKPDIKRGAVFSAIRGGYIDFYYKGGRLFTFQKEFNTHKKYASIILSKGDYLSASDLKLNVELIQDFPEGYESIKENCSLYSGVEAKGVSELYHKFSYIQKDLNVVVLDIEVSFKSDHKDKSQDRIDILVFNKKAQMLRFYEAKHFSNNELWSKSGTQPKVIKQIDGYEKQVEKRHSEILSQYKNYTRIANELFDCDLPEPKEIDDKVALLAFGYDRDQQQGRMKQLLIDDGSLKDIQYYFVGDISKVVINNMWKAMKCG